MASWNFLKNFTVFFFENILWKEKNVFDQFDNYNDAIQISEFWKWEWIDLTLIMAPSMKVDIGTVQINTI